MSEDRPPVPKVAAPHVCSGPGCYFCEWPNPILELPEQETQ